MTVATLQRLVLIGLVSAAALSLALGYRFDRPAAGLICAAGILLLHAIVLAFEFVLLRTVEAPADRPHLRSLVVAWWFEVLTTPSVFCWRQPFRLNDVPDRLPDVSTGTRGVLLVHGLFCNRAFWNPWLTRLEARGRACVAVNLEPAFASIGDAYADSIDSACRQLASATGAPPVVVAHSMGGLAVRYWLQRDGAAKRVHHVITIGTPHQGTWLARFGRTSSARQMAVGSEWLHCLAGRESTDTSSRFTCFYSRCDNVVFPSRNAQLRGANNRLVDGHAHVALAFAEEVFVETLRRLDDAPSVAHNSRSVDRSSEASSSPSVETRR